jgi:hypothetical protein
MSRPDDFWIPVGKEVKAVGAIILALLSAAVVIAEEILKEDD